MDYRNYIVDLISKIKSETALKKIYKFVNRIFVKGE